MSIIPFQTHLQSAVSQVFGNLEHARWLEEINLIDKYLMETGIDDSVIHYMVEKAKAKAHTPLSHKQLVRIQERALKSLRATVLRIMEGTSLRKFCSDVARSPDMQRFCRVDSIGRTKIFARSTVEGYEKAIPAELIENLHNHLLDKCTDSEDATNLLELERPLSLCDLYVDTTCLRANIHMPADWLLLRDAVRTLTKAVTLIRDAGLKNRMSEEPQAFLTAINRLCIKMTHTSIKGKHAAKGRKKRRTIFREMRKVAEKVQRHAEKHYAILADSWSKTNYSEGDAQKILRRLEGIIEQLPTAIEQAANRILHGTMTPNNEKILSLYENDIHVLIRGKAGADKEFGNKLFIAEQEEGLIVNWSLAKDSVPSDSQMLIDALEKNDNDLRGTAVEAIFSDRGFDGPDAREELEMRCLYNGLCPRSPKGLQENLKDQRFRYGQRRRANTEARIAIVKHVYLGDPINCRGYENRNRRIAQGILVHNLRKLAVISIRQAEEREEIYGTRALAG
jgi:hypothetical protein